eukprot:s1587_g1.t1
MTRRRRRCGTGRSSRALAALLAASFFPHAAGADQHEHCDSWAEAGECEANPDFMWGSCESSCSRRGPRPAAQDVPAYDKAHCASWAEVGECEANSAFMMAACPESCRGRGPATKEKAPPHTEAEESASGQRQKEQAQAPREKFEIARQLDDASAREQHLWERGEAANSRAQLSEERLRNCLNDLSEANHERQKLRVQRSEGVSDTYEHRFQDLSCVFRGPRQPAPTH